MDVECMIHCNGFKIPDNTDGNKILYVKDDTGYNNVKVGIKEYINGAWVVRCEGSVDGCTLIRAINNAMNS